MFHKRAQGSSVDNSGTLKQMLLTEVEPLSSIEKSTLAETLRGVEMERQLASEERYAAWKPRYSKPLNCGYLAIAAKSSGTD